MTFSNLGILLIVSCCIIYSHSSIPGQCGGEIDILPGRNYTFQTPGYPAQLAPNLRCDWILYTPEGYDVEFLGGEFEVDYTNYFPNIFSRSADYLYLSLDPPVPTNSTRFASLASGAQYVGNKAPEGVLFPNTNKLHATFITNDDNNHHFGFRIAIRAVSQPAPSASCNRNLTIGSDGAIIQYERKNPRETFCQWNIFIPQGAQTLLRVENLHLPIYLPEPLPYNDDRREYVVCEEEYLEIQEKDYGIVESSLAHNAGTLILRDDRLCFNKNHQNRTYILYSQNFTLTFRSHPNAADRGFRLALEPYNVCATVFSEPDFNGMVLNIVEDSAQKQGVRQKDIPKIRSLKLQQSCMLYYISENSRSSMANSTTNNLILPPRSSYILSQFSCICPNQEVKPDDKNYFTWLWITLTFASVAVGLTAGLVFAYARKRQQQKTNPSTVSTRLARRFLGSLYDEYKIQAWNLKADTDAVGSGCYGMVWKGILTTSPERLRQLSVSPSMQSASHAQSAVAIKRRQSGSAVSEKEFMEEIAMMAKAASHVNVVQLVGIVTEGCVKLVMEYCEHGSLDVYLRNKRLCGTTNQTSNNQQFLDYARQICSGMQHLASKEIIHRDLAARNIMVSQCDVLKISDFGMAKCGPVYSEIRKDIRSPIAWMSPESILIGEYSYSTDVWSFGVVVWEIFTWCQLPYVDQLGSCMAQDILNFLDSGNRLKQPEPSPDEVYHIMLSCWEWKKSERPSFDSLNNKLQRLQVDALNYRYVVFTPQSLV